MKILHIPRTGGTAIKASLIKGYRYHTKNMPFMKTKIKNLYVCDHKQKLDNKDQYIIFIRDPIKRFVSHWIFLKKHAAGYDTENYMNPSIDKAIRNYDDINNFIHDIHKLKLRKLMTISDILISSKNVQNCKNNILFIGRTEHLGLDFIAMQAKINLKKYIYINKNYTNARPEKYDEMTKLSKSSYKKLKDYLHNDYLIIHKLYQLGFIGKDYLKEISCVNSTS